MFYLSYSLIDDCLTNRSCTLSSLVVTAVSSYGYNFVYVTIPLFGFILLLKYV